jgi:hypothetical protein
MLTRAPIGRSQSADVASSLRHVDFGQAESIGGVGGDSSIGLSEDIEANQFTTESANAPKSREFSRRNGSYYDDDSAMLWSEDPEKEYFEYMLQREQETRARQGKSSEDSLIGQSTVDEIQKTSRWHQIGGQDSCELGEDGNQSLETGNSFPILSTYNNKEGGNSCFGGYSLATTEKSKRHSDEDHPDVGHDQGSKRCGCELTLPTMFPNYIYVGDASSVPPSLGKNSTDQLLGTREVPRSRCFYIVVFFLGGLALAGAAVAVYLSVTSKETGSKGTSSSAAASSQASVIRISGPPTHHPSSPWLSQQNDDTSRSPISTLAPSSQGSYAVTEPLTPSPTIRPFLANVAEAVPTSAPSKQPTVALTKDPTVAPTGGPTPVPTVEEQLPTPAPTTSTTIRCGCIGCSSVWTTMADAFSCGERISFLVSERAYPEIGACRLVGGIEFPTECGPCDPEDCESINMAILATESEPSSAPLPYTPGLSLMPTTSSPTSLKLKAIANDGIPINAFPLGRCEGKTRLLSQS